MASWQELSRESLRAAKQIVVRSPRSSMSRSYYAAFSAITATLQSNSHEFPRGWSSPRHKDVVRLLIKYGDPLTKAEISRHIGTLYKYRIGADYVPSGFYEAEDAVACVRISSRVMRLVGSI